MAAAGKATQNVHNFDEMRAARQEKAGPPPIVIVGGKEWELPQQIPVAAVEAMSLGKFVTTLRLLFGDNAMSSDDIRSFDMDDVQELLATVYGVDSGKA